MSLDLCTVREAVKPFYLQSIGVSIYSIEELCFFLKENICLIDRTIVNTDLCKWVRDELGLKTLSRKMMDAIERPDNDVSYFIMPVFVEIGYLNGSELHALRGELTRLQVRPEDERKKMRADYLVESGRYSSAVSIYKSLLSEDHSPSSLGAQFYASIWNNLGCTYALQFRFKNAADCFLQGWRLVRSRELMRKYVSTLPLYLEDEEYRETLEKLGADPVLIGKIQEYNLSLAEETAERLKNRPAGKLTDEEILRQFQKEYRRGSFS